MSNTYEWCRAGIASRKKAMQSVPTNICRKWLESFIRREPYIIQNVADCKETEPEIYHNMQMCIRDRDTPPYEMLKVYTAIARKSEKTLPKRTFSYEVLNKPGIDILSPYIQRHELESTLTNARFLKEFEIYIQPKIDLHTHKISGGEVLTRWIHEGTLIPLSDFLPTLKENGEMYMIDLAHFETM